MGSDRETGRCDRAAGRLLGKLRRACRRWDLLPADGRLAVAVSGGADSLVLAELLHRLAPTVPGGLELVAFHVRLDAAGVTEGLVEPARRWLEARGIPVRMVPPRFDPGEGPPAGCFQCARIRRRTLLEAAEAEGIRRVAVGHHADDVVETWLLSLFFTGTPETMVPRRSYFSGAVKLVRPLFEIRRQEIHRVARLCGVPVARPSCALEREGTRRDAVRRALQALGRDERRVRRQLFWAAVRSLENEDGGTSRAVDSCDTVGGP